MSTAKLETLILVISRLLNESCSISETTDSHYARDHLAIELNELSQIDAC